VLAPGQRADLLLDCPNPPGSRFAVVDHGDPLEPGALRPRRLVALRYGAAVRPAPPTEAVVLPPNRLPTPDLAGAVPCRILLTGGAMGGLARAELEGEELDMARLMRRGRAWALNGVVGSSHYHFGAPLLRLRQGQTAHLSVVNQTAWRHPIHLHGFPMLQLDGSGAGQWRDTVLMQPGEQIELVFVAERPGQWMFHCHILEHQAGGMMGFVNVDP
jgi:FtsP/CotA-like multicopper oxidase with cupredoxin domain